MVDFRRRTRPFAATRYAVWSVAPHLRQSLHNWRMQSGSPLPDSFRAAPAFTVATAQSQGVSRGRLRSRSLQRPFHGIRSTSLDLDRVEHKCRALAANMRQNHAFSHVTAAVLMGVPLPRFVEAEASIHVTALAPARAPEGRGIIGHRMSMVPADLTTLGDLLVTSPPYTWSVLAGILQLHDLVAAGDFLVTGNPFDGVAPLCTMAELREIVERRKGERGHRERTRALALVRQGPLSRPESLLRLLIHDSGLPEPQINESLHNINGSFLAMPDLCWPDVKVALEYEGDHHREMKQFRKDIHRIERLVDEGWIVMKVSAEDLFHMPYDLSERLARRLQSRGRHGKPRQLRHMVRFRA
jgi:hypothetical protein